MTSAQTEKASSRLRRAGRARAASTARRAAAYTVLGLLCFLCLFFFYILLINATRTHFEIQRGFSLLPGRSLLTNLKSVLANANIPVLSGIRNSLLVSALSALLSVYFSALTAYGIHAYDFKFKKLAFTFILLIMMMPHTGIRAGLCSAHHQNGHGRHPRTAVSAQHRGARCILFHAAVHGRQPAHGDRRGRAH